MILQTVHFTGFDVDPISLLEPRRLLGTIPVDWPRIRFDTDHNYGKQFDKWLLGSMNYRYAFYTVRLGGHRTVVVAFERATDAVMFRLKNGERAWAENFEE